MPCYQVGDPSLKRGRPAVKEYGSKAACESDCAGSGTGACKNLFNTGCVEVRPCQCYGVFLGIGTKCNPLP